MAIYQYRSTMPSVTDTIEGVVFTSGIPKDYSTDQLTLNKYVPTRLDRYVDGVCSNLDLVHPDIVTAQERYDLANTGAVVVNVDGTISEPRIQALVSGAGNLVSDGGVVQTITLFAAGGSQAAPLGGTINSLTFGKFGLPGSGRIKIPANTVPSSVAGGVGYAVVEVVATVKKGGTTAGTNITLWIGPTNSAQDTTVANPSMGAADTTAKFTWHCYISGNTIDSSAPGWKDNVGGTSAISTGGAWDNTVDNYVTLGSNNLSTSDTLALVGLVVKLHVNPTGALVANLLSAPITVPATFHGICSQDWPWNGSAVGTAPTFPVGRLSNYDNKAVHWNRLHQSANTINWTDLDTWVTNAKAAGVSKGVYVIYGTPQFLASSGGAIAAPYGTAASIFSGGGAFPNYLDASLAQTTYFCTQLANRNKTNYGGFFDRISLWNEPDFTTNPSSSTFWWGTRPQFVDMLYIMYTALKAADPSLIVMGPGTYSVIDANTGFNQWVSQAGTLNPTKRGYDCYDEFAGHPYHARPFGYSGNGDIVGLQLGGTLAVASAAKGTPASGKPYGVTEYGISSGVGTELTWFLAQSTAFRETFVQRLWIDALLSGVTFMTAFSLGNVSNLMGNLSTDDPGAISGLRKIYNATVGKTITAGGVMPDQTRRLTFSDGTTYSV